MITNLIFGQYNEAVIKELQKNEGDFDYENEKIFTLALVVLCALGMLTGCEKQESGTVSADGSTSMAEVIGLLNESFEAENEGITITYNPTVSGIGITALAEGRCYIGLSSRDLQVTVGTVYFSTGTWNI